MTTSLRERYFGVRKARFPQWGQRHYLVKFKLVCISTHFYEKFPYFSNVYDTNPKHFFITGKIMVEKLGLKLSKYFITFQSMQNYKSTKIIYYQNPTSQGL